MNIGNVRTHLEGTSLEASFEDELNALITRYEQRIAHPRIAIQGIPGSFSDEAASKRFASFETIACGSFRDAFDAIEKGIADFGLIPVENSIHGPVVETYDLLARRDLFVLEEMKMRIVHCLIGAGSSEVYSHPQALGQCERFIHERRLTPVPYYDTAGAVKERSDALAIGSARAAQIYDAPIVERDVGPTGNSTRFFLLGQRPSSGPSDKGAAIFALREAHEAGTLAHALANLESFGVNLTKIESRPAGNFTYRFVIEYEWSDEIPAALRALEEHCAYVKDLGSFRVVGIE